MTPERIDAWARLYLRRESVPPESAERENIDDALDVYWFDATPEQRTAFTRMMTAVDTALGLLVEKPS